MYAFDVHCNSYFPLFILLYGEIHHDVCTCSFQQVALTCASEPVLFSAVIQFLFSPVLLHRNLLSTILSIMLYVVALSYYHYLNFLGYSALPFLDRTEVSKSGLTNCRCCALAGHVCDRAACQTLLWLQVFLWPIGGIVMIAVFAVLTNFNPTRFTLGFYFA